MPTNPWYPKVFPCCCLRFHLTEFCIKTVASFEMQISSGVEGGRAKGDSTMSCFHFHLFNFLFTILCELVNHLLPKLTDKLRIGSRRNKREKKTREGVIAVRSLLGVGWRIPSTKQAGNAMECQGRRNTAL